MTVEADMKETGTAGLLEAARHVAEIARDHRRSSDELRYLAPEAFAAVRDAGLLRLLMPRRYGGFEASMATMVECLAAVAEGCPSAAWNIMIANTTAWHFGRRDRSMQDEVFSSPEVVISGAISPGGSAVKADGGWIVSGRYPFLSFVRYADWVFFPVACKGEDGSDDILSLYCPSSDIKLLDTWHTLGLRGTGSTDGVLEKLFVPDRRVVRNEDRNAVTEDSLRHATNLYKMPVVCVLPLFIGAVVLGAARRGLQVFTEALGSRTERYSGRAKEQSQAMQIRLARAASRIDAGALMLQEAARLYDERCEADEILSLSERARVKWLSVAGTDFLRQGVNEIFDGSGGTAVYDSSELQAIFRNIHTATHHAVCDIDPAAETYGKILLGAPVDERII
nr:acyl-CoA dehydrogenase family protein [Sphingomonas sp. Y57]